MNKLLKKSQAEIDEFYCCPHHPKLMENVNAESLKK